MLAEQKAGTMKYAEESNYWDTTVHPSKSQGEIVELLEDFGADQIMVVQGQSAGKFAWLIRFRWNGANYRFIFTPKTCRYPSKTSTFGGKKRAHPDQARFQMGRTAAWFVKAILTATEERPESLFGFMELPGGGMHPSGIPYIASELDTRELIALAPPSPEMPFLLNPPAEE